MSDESGQENLNAPSVEVRAREMGWKPAEEYNGPKDRWVDAQTFVDKGEQIMPILRANNERLEADNRRLSEQVTGATRALAEMRDSVAALEDFHSEETARKVKDAREKVLAELALANKDGDHVAAATLTGELSKLDADAAVAAAAPKDKPAANDDTAARNAALLNDPVSVAFRAQHPWYGDTTNPENRRRTSIALAIANELRFDPANAGLKGTAFLDKVIAETEKVMPRAARGNAERVGESRPSGGGGGSGAQGKTYADLPQDAKEACEKQGLRLVGENKVHKTIDSWRKRYAEIYFKE